MNQKLPGVSSAPYIGLRRPEHNRRSEPDGPFGQTADQMETCPNYKTFIKTKLISKTDNRSRFKFNPLIDNLIKSNIS